MKRRRLPPKNQLPTRALVAFVATVVLAVIASVVVLLPDTTVKSADSLVRVPNDLGQWIPSDIFN